MEIVQPLEWSRMLIGAQPLGYLLEIIIKVISIYLFALIFLRAGGKKSRKQFTPLEMLLVVALGSAVGDVMFNPSLPLMYPALIILVVMVMQYTINEYKKKSRKLQLFIDSAPRMLVKHGKIRDGAMRDEGVSDHELYSILRLSGVRNLNEVEYAYLELTGEYSVFKADQPYSDVDYEITPAPKVDPFYSS